MFSSLFLSSAVQSKVFLLTVPLIPVLYGQINEFLGNLPMH